MTPSRHELEYFSDPPTHKKKFLPHPTTRSKKNRVPPALPPWLILEPPLVKIKKMMLDLPNIESGLIQMIEMF